MSADLQLNGDPVRGPALWWRQLAFGPRARADVWQLLADVTESGVALDEALTALMRGYHGTGRRARALVLAEMSAGIAAQGASGRLAPYISPSERLILEGLDASRADVAFASAARLLRTRLALRKALSEAIAMPILLTVGLFGLILFFGLELLPAFAEIVDFEQLPPVQAITVGVTLALAAHPLRLLLWSAAIALALLVVMRVWTGRGRALADRVPPFSVMRLQAGTAFLFAVIEYGRTGAAITPALLERMAQATGRYEASRIRALAGPLERDDNLGTAALAAGQGFPDQEMAVVMQLLWPRPHGIDRAGQFLTRRLAQIEADVKARMAVLNAVLLTLVTVVLVLLMSIMLPVFDQINAGQGL